MFRSLALAAAVSSLWSQPVFAVADNARYRVESEPQRLAVIIGNSSYANLGPLLSVRRDTAEVRARLRKLGFTIASDHENIRTAGEFETIVLPELRRQIQPGALVVVYYSGHGFAYGPHNYFAMTDLKPAIREDEILDLAVPVESLEVWLSDRRPGMLLFLVDACRSIAGFVVSPRASSSQPAAQPSADSAIPSNDDSNAPLGSVVDFGLRLERGAPEAKYDFRSTNTIAGYAAKHGSTALGAEREGELSLFTSSLVRYLGTDERSFESAFNDVSAEVGEATHDAQVPGIYDWSSTELFLKPTPAFVSQERAAWEAALASGSRADVGRFQRRHSVSRQSAAARQWLEENPEGAQSYTALSPAAVERAWELDLDTVAINRADTGFAFERNLFENASFANAISNVDLGIVSPGHREPAYTSTEVGRELALLQMHGGVVATQAFDVREAPSATAQLADRVKAGTNLILHGFTRARDGKTWARVSNLAKPGEFFLQVVEPKAKTSVRLGRPIREVVLPPLNGGIPDLVQPEQLEAALAGLRAERRTVTWVSVAAAETPDADTNDARQARMVHAQYLLKQGGIEGTRITSVLGEEESLGEGVRLRFFGF